MLSQLGQGIGQLFCVGRLMKRITRYKEEKVACIGGCLFFLRYDLMVNVAVDVIYCE